MFTPFVEDNLTKFNNGYSYATLVICLIIFNIVVVFYQALRIMFLKARKVFLRKRIQRAHLNAQMYDKDKKHRESLISLLESKVIDYRSPTKKHDADMEFT